jgi:hypothetical protein
MSLQDMLRGADSAAPVSSRVEKEANDLWAQFGLARPGTTTPSSSSSIAVPIEDKSNPHLGVQISRDHVAVPGFSSISGDSSTSNKRARIESGVADPSFWMQQAGSHRNDSGLVAKQVQEAAGDIAKTLQSLGKLQNAPTPHINRRPCTFFLQNRCIKGSMCPFSHDPGVAPEVIEKSFKPEFGTFKNGVLQAAYESSEYMSVAERQNTFESVEGFLALHQNLSDTVAQQLREMPPRLQLLVMSHGVMRTAREPSAVLVARMGKAASGQLEPGKFCPSCRDVQFGRSVSCPVCKTPKPYGPTVRNMGNAHRNSAY